MTSNATIAEIARQAGVGTATVDRVINGRAGVNGETMQRVMQAITALGKPTVVRGRPRMRENFRFAYVLPEMDSAFVDLVERQIAQSAGDFRHQHITELTQRFSLKKSSGLSQALAQLDDCDGLALLAPDTPAVRLAINEAVQRGIHVVTLFTDVADCARQTCVGMNNLAAGRTAALLLGRMAQGLQRDTLLVLSQTTGMAADLQRLQGFQQGLAERFAHLCVTSVTDLPSDAAATHKAMMRLAPKTLDTYRLAGVYCLGAGADGVAAALSTWGLATSVGVVAHDATQAHVDLLAGGGVAYVLHQDIHYSVLAAARILRGLCDNVRGALNVVQAKVEILTAENLH
jgi:LacI family transcriptional regulator